MYTSKAHFLAQRRCTKYANHLLTPCCYWDLKIALQKIYFLIRVFIIIFYYILFDSKIINFKTSLFSYVRCLISYIVGLSVWNVHTIFSSFLNIPAWIYYLLLVSPLHLLTIFSYLNSSYVRPKKMKVRTINIYLIFILLNNEPQNGFLSGKNNTQITSDAIAPNAQKWRFKI